MYQTKEKSVKSKSASYSITLSVITGVLGIAILYSYVNPWSIIIPDSTTYLRLAEEIQKGNWHIPQWGRGVYDGPLLYSLVTAVVELVIPGFENSGTIVSIIAASAMVIPLSLLTRHFYGGKMAWVIIPLTLLNPAVIMFVSLTLTEALFSLLFLITLLLTFRAVTGDSSKLWFAVGLVSTASWMTRDAGLILLFLSLLWFIFGIYNRKPTVQWVVKNGFALIFGIILIYVPFKLMLVIDHEGISDLQNNSVKFQLMMPELNNFLEREKYLGALNVDNTEYAFVEAQRTPVNLAEILSHWNSIAKKVGSNLIAVANGIYFMLGLVFVIFIFIAIFMGIFFERKTFKGTGGAILFLGPYLFFYLLFYCLAGGFTNAIGPERYLVPLIPILGIIAVGGIYHISRVFSRFKINYLDKLIILLSLGIFLIVYVPGIKRANLLMNYRKEIAKSYKKLGTEIRKISYSSGMDHMSIMSRYPLLPYYADASWVITPYGEYQEILRFAKNKGVNFVYLENQSPFPRPQLKFLLNSHVSVPEMERVYWKHSKGNSEEFSEVLYRIKK